MSQSRACQVGWWVLSILVLPMVIALGANSSAATPPQYSTFKRDQRINYSPDPDALMRIWMVYVGQGDGILIQLPMRSSYDPDTSDGDNSRSERIEVLVDGGAFKSADVGNMAEFIRGLYGPQEVVIEHATISHHDSDHVQGITRILQSDTIGIEHIYHNGLASYRPGTRDFPSSGKPTNAVFKDKNGNITRGMAFLEADRKTLKTEYFIPNRQTLASRRSEFQGVYKHLANALLDKSDPISVRRFDRAFAGAPFIKEREADLARADLSEVNFELVWPRADLTRYAGWSETINGNSITFRLSYGDFEMLFTGDHNEKSEEHLLGSGVELGSCDVLKVPHHGSGHALREFFKSSDCSPVISIASMGETGARSKAMGRSNWQHPSTDVISWLGGAHRVYHTQLHEKRFRWDQIKTKTAHERLYERTHILIETDGLWFRVVEVPLGHGDLNRPPPVNSVRRSNGTRWIKAK